MNTLTVSRAARALDTVRTTDRQSQPSLPDRVAMRVALALLLWSTRPRRSKPTFHDLVRRERLLAAAERERAWLLLSHVTSSR
ncbi:hypothetical protein NQ166_08945 [Microbacterium sp. zg.Y1090]|uniref:hypothetical protein n=1 Tax=Microbacterium TaxID=33882 RepID=UPI00214AE98D|nr:MULTISPECIES: hypothetical protein [unclassified Microbacterium]MCR2811625.1 hypothetical protein [Microbacterium sp. zg.Y1084]MCR2818953.1 hypothetical protein [Microbacterium sp. zg.Y1090]MDL5487603.1 hypothetical protein [Microbacterium sp. zg-Y1211]WIM27259.1 hypothetical protein QNO26_08755 [Microbacterium sp. zg-Y1090]